MDGIKLPIKISRTLESFTEQLKRAYGDELVSVILYGSASSGEFSNKYSNVNLIVILADTSLASLSRARSIVNSRRFRTINPIFFTETFMTGSLDVFPIEFLDITENYTILHGKDVVKGLKVDGRNLRFQCEQELRAKLINIRRSYLSAGNRKALEILLFKTFTSLVHILRNLLRLKGVKPPYLKEDVISESAGTFGIDASVLGKILEAKNMRITLSGDDLDTLLSAFVKELESVVSVVDKL